MKVPQNDECYIVSRGISAIICPEAAYLASFIDKEGLGNFGTIPMTPKEIRKGMKGLKRCGIIRDGIFDKERYAELHELFTKAHNEAIKFLFAN